jgi:hypothetical protein
MLPDFRKLFGNSFFFRTSYTSILQAKITVDATTGTPSYTTPPRSGKVSVYKVSIVKQKGTVIEIGNI